MSRFKLEFILKQHTPIIHFQSDQGGATLRATELKPKFDRFLLKQVPDIPFIKNANGSKSLDYKVKIEPDISRPESIDERDPLFFGNMGDGEDKKFKTHNRTFKIEFFSFNATVLEGIKDNFEAFLANTNFGTRQSKGFGSFYLSDKSFNLTLIPYRVYHFHSRNWWRDIGRFYQFLRQGINLKNKVGETTIYTKTAIFSYAKRRGWQWDKKTIKDEFFADELLQQSGEAVAYSSDEKYLLRDLFGLSSSQEWMSYNATITKEHPNIERFKSPITFKVVDDTVYFWVNESYRAVLGEEFEINNGGESFNLSYPDVFDFDVYLAYAMNINLSQHIEGEFHSSSEYAVLDNILRNINIMATQ